MERGCPLRTDLLISMGVHWGMRADYHTSGLPLSYDIPHDQGWEEGEVSYVPRWAAHNKRGLNCKYTEGGGCNTVPELPFLIKSHIAIKPP